MEVGDFRPTEQSYAVKRELTAAIDEQLARYRQVLRQEVPTLNRLVQEQAVPLIEPAGIGP